MENKNLYSVSVVVPVYRSAKSLHLLYERCARQLESLTSDWEMILVDDASPDDSWLTACALHDLNPKVKAVRLATNHGQQHATLCGLGYVSKDYVITIDDDLQCLPEDMPLFFDSLVAGKSVVIGRIARKQKQHHWLRNIGSTINQRLAGKILGKPKELSLSSYRGMTKRVAHRLVSYKGAHPHIAALLFKSVPLSEISNVDIRHAERGDGGATSYSVAKLVKTLSYLLINHSYLPLRFMIGWGTLISLASLAFALWVLIRGLFWGPTHGWTSLALLISFLSGNILLALGIVGEYLGRLVEESSNISQFSVFDERM
jgi:glycosyltransferase involved in cell wall biosynthesis